MANTNDFGAFDDYFTGTLEMEPQTAYMGAVGRMPYYGTSPMRQRAQDYWGSQYSDIYNQYLGVRGNELAQRKDPSQMTSFMDYLEQYPFTQRYSSLTPYQKGTGTSRFAPSTRHIYF